MPRLVELAQQMSEEALAKKIEETRAKTDRALDMRLDVTRDPNAAKRLAERHNSHVVADDIADLIWKYCVNRSPELLSQIDAIRSRVKKEGLFVKRYTEEMEAHRLTATYSDGTPEFLIVEASGRHDKEWHPRYRTVAPAADAQFHLPEAKQDAAPVLIWPDTSIVDGEMRDVPNDTDLIDAMRFNPHCVALLEDLATDRGMDHLKLAASAAHRGIIEIVKVLNANRGKHPIEYVAAEIMSVQGILKDGHIIRLQGDMKVSPIANTRSLDVAAHFESPFCETFEPAWIRRNQLVPVSHPVVQALVVDWHVKASRLKR